MDAGMFCKPGRLRVLPVHQFSSSASRMFENFGRNQGYVTVILELKSGRILAARCPLTGLKGNLCMSDGSV